MRVLMFLVVCCMTSMLAAQVTLGACDGFQAPSSESLKAEQALDRGDVNMGRVYLSAIQRKSPNQKIHFLYLSAEWNVLMGRMEAALSLFSEVYKICPNYQEDLPFKIGALLAGQDRSEEAKPYFKTFLIQSNPQNENRKYVEKQLNTWRIVDSLRANPVQFKPYLISGLDREPDEFLGILSPDEKTWYFTRRLEIIDRMSGPAPVRRLLEQFCTASHSNGSAGSIEVMSSPFNQGFNEGGPSLTADNNLMAITSCELLSNGYRNCDIFLVSRESGNWMPFKSIGTVNRSESWESQPTLSANGDRLIFTSNRKGGFGGLDLYEVLRQPDGSWSEAQNLGPRVNTPDDEKSPFLHADGHTLFFSSNGHPGLGDFDVFVLDLQGPHGPQNLGYPINTERAEVGFAVAAKSPMAYFSSNEKVGDLPAGSGYDFYGFPLPASATADAVTFLTGKVEGADVLPDGVSLRIENLQTREITRVRVDAASGTYTAVLATPNAADYVISVENPEVGYTAVRMEVDPRDEEAEVPLLEAKRLEVGESFSLNSIQFATNSYQMSALDKASLAPFVAYLQAHPSMTIELQGHTDNVGRPGDNQVLSQRRAEAVHAYLLSQGVPAAQMRAKGYGDSQPVADNRLPEGRAKNRRTVFQVLTK